MKAIIYARQSSGSDDISESVENQIANCKKQAEKENYQVIGIFSDLNTSGKTYPEGAESIAENDSAFLNWYDQQTGTKKYRHGLGEVIKLLICHGWLFRSTASVSVRYILLFRLS